MAEKDTGVDLVRVTSVALHPPGSIFTQENGRSYRYVRAGAAIALGDVLIDDVAEETYAVTPVAAADTPLAGCWPNEGDGSGRSRAAITDNYYFWMLEEGDALVKAAATVVAGQPAVPIGTAGTVDDTAAAAANALAMAAGVGAIFLGTTSGGYARVRFRR